jgi:hypothetical protein
LVICVAGHAGQAHDAAQQVALQQQLVNLRVMPGFLNRGRLEIALVAAGFVLVFGPAATAFVAPNQFNGALGAKMLRVNHLPKR